MPRLQLGGNTGTLATDTNRRPSIKTVEGDNGAAVGDEVAHPFTPCTLDDRGPCGVGLLSTPHHAATTRSAQPRHDAGLQAMTQNPFATL